MPHPKPHPKAHPPATRHFMEGRFQHIVFSPKGGIEGVLVEVDGKVNQFVADPQDAAISLLFSSLKQGQKLVLEGTAQEAPLKGKAAHAVYQLTRLVAVDGVEHAAPDLAEFVSGTVVRFNYAKHGEANGVVLDSGDFVHTRPDGLKPLELKVGDKVEAEGPVRALVTGTGRVLEARHVNGQAVGPAH